MKAAKRSESDELALDSSTWADRAGAGVILDSDPFLGTILGDREGTKEVQGTGSEDISLPWEGTKELQRMEAGQWEPLH